jgi:hypothetical protein
MLTESVIIIDIQKEKARLIDIKRISVTIIIVTIKCFSAGASVFKQWTWA